MTEGGALAAGDEALRQSQKMEASARLTGGLDLPRSDKPLVASGAENRPAGLRRRLRGGPVLVVERASC